MVRDPVHLTKSARNTFYHCIIAMKKYYYKLSTVKIREFVIKSHQYVYTKAHSICTVAFVLHTCS